MCVMAVGEGGVVWRGDVWCSRGEKLGPVGGGRSERPELLFAAHT